METWRRRRRRRGRGFWMQFQTPLGFLLLRKKSLRKAGGMFTPPPPPNDKRKCYPDMMGISKMAVQRMESMQRRIALPYAGLVKSSTVTSVRGWHLVRISEKASTLDYSWKKARDIFILLQSQTHNIDTPIAFNSESSSFLPFLNDSPALKHRSFLHRWLIIPLAATSAPPETVATLCLPLAEVLMGPKNATSFFSDKAAALPHSETPGDARRVDGSWLFLPYVFVRSSVHLVNSYKFHALIRYHRLQTKV